MTRSAVEWCVAGMVVLAVAQGSIHIAEAQRGPSLAVEAQGELRDALTRELGALGNVHVTEQRRRARYVVHGNVTQLDVVDDGGRSRIDCEVSLLVADREGNVRAMLRGRASGSGVRVAPLTESVLRAAVRGALRPLPNHLR